MRKVLLFVPLLLVAVALVGADSMAPGIQLRANSTYQGYVTWSDTIYFAAFTGVGTGDIIDFSQVYLGAGGDVWPRMGICSDDSATNITLTALTEYTLTYNWTGAGGAVRIWCPDLGQPVTVEGGTLSSWDATYQVATIMPTNDIVTIRWYHVATEGLFDAVDLFMSFMPFVVLMMIIGAVKYKDYRTKLIIMAATGGLLILLANLITAWGL